MPDQYREPIEDNANSSAEAPEVKTGSPEQEILELEKTLAAKKAAWQPEKEKKLEGVLEQEKTASPAPPSAPPIAASPAPAPSSIKSDSERIRGFEKNQQLKSLVDLAFEKGVYYATEVVKNLDNPYMLDEFHDVLVDELHKKLVERGKLKEV